MTSRTKRRIWIWLPILGIGAVLAALFPLHYHLAFDAHHTSTHPLHWCAGWFRDWRLGPLSVSLIEGPRKSAGPVSRQVYRWRLRRLDPRAEILHWDSHEGKRIALSWLPATKEFLAYAEGLAQVKARHVETAERVSEACDAAQLHPPALTWYAWAPHRWSIRRGRGPTVLLGRRAPAPSPQLEDWYFDLFLAEESEPFPRVVRIGFDRETRKWYLDPEPAAPEIDVSGFFE